MEEKSVRSYDFPQEASYIDKKFGDSSEPVENLTANSEDNLIADRGNWSRPIEFILSCMNFAIGLGNVWRYPYLAYRNGGGAFLIPYLLAACFIGLPIFFAELIVGQYSALGPIKAFAFLAPFFKGLGYCTLLVITFIEIYYFVIIAWVLFYFYTSMFPSLLWGSCDNDWNTDYCYNLIADIECQSGNNNDAFDQLFFQDRCQTVTEICEPRNLIPLNASFCSNATHVLPMSDIITRVLSSEEFFYEHVLGIGDARWDNFGYPRWQMVICLFSAWALSALCLLGGVKSVGKIVYFTATFPYVILTALLVRALTLEGSIDGIMFYITPQWERLLSPGVWGDASSQIFYSFSLALGSLITLASYNKFKNNAHFDATIVSLINYLTAFYSGLAVFAILGFLAHQMNVPVDSVASSGPGLSFITFPEAILLMPGSQIWAILFFFMMIILGLGSTFAGVQAITTAIIDRWPRLRKDEWKVTIATCLSGFILGLPMTCHGGIYLFTLMEWHTASWAILLIGFAEVVILSWVYGINNTMEMIKEMGMKIWKVVQYYWKATWVVITPFYAVGVFIFILTGIGPTQFRGYIFPVWADVLGWLFGTATLVPFVVFAIIELIKTDDIKKSFRPTENWGPQEVDGRRVDRAVLT
ncbi:hypothetical protein PVAND_009872 [Polypedilum vanderplanki]|uniref:Transporter n=1 Tax=Polypedilum vanderplanki TaxID=319348 RepID=A0A9J6CF11_POLVA|nr:hypothetical protein PVAND_009872 [Polypedilum vanderplanki]